MFQSNTFSKEYNFASCWEASLSCPFDSIAWLMNDSHNASLRKDGVYVLSPGWHNIAGARLGLGLKNLAASTSCLQSSQSSCCEGDRTASWRHPQEEELRPPAEHPSKPSTPLPVLEVSHLKVNPPAPFQPFPWHWMEERWVNQP